MKTRRRFPKQFLSPLPKGVESLTRMNRWPSLKKNWDGKHVHIWSNEWEAYWGPDGCGYYTEKDMAGIYTFEDAWSRTSHCGPEKQIQYWEVKE